MPYGALEHVGNKVKKSIIVGVMLLASVPSAQAFNYMGVGGQTCGKFIQTYNSNQELRLMIISWIQGWISRGNAQWWTQQNEKNTVSNQINFDIIKGQDYASITTWIQNYCRAHPLRDIADTAIALEGALIKNKTGE